MNRWSPSEARVPNSMRVMSAATHEEKRRHMSIHARQLGLLTATVLAALALAACGDSDSDTSRPAFAVEGFATEAATTAASEVGEGGEDGQVRGMAPKEFFVANCAACHGANREGGVGLPLTPEKLTQNDAFYQDTIKNGRSGTAMAAVGTILGLSDDEIATLVTFLKTDQP